MEVDPDGVQTYVDFEVISILEKQDQDPYPRTYRDWLGVWQWGYFEYETTMDVVWKGAWAA